MKKGDRLLSRSEHDVYGPVQPRRVEELFVRVGEIVHLHVAGKVIRTTPEHPFYVLGQGWTDARELKAGDWLATLEGPPVRVDDFCDAGETATVYNFRIAEFHTYFVGTDAWGFSVWTHNAEYDVGRYGDRVSVGEMHHDVLDAWANENIPGYFSRAGHNPAMELSGPNHSATKAVYREWLKEKYGKSVGAKVDWKNTSPRTASELSERMFDAANVPQSARAEYHSKFTRYIYEILGGQG